jgi:hypothetical protein
MMSSGLNWGRFASLLIYLYVSAALIIFVLKPEFLYLVTGVGVGIIIIDTIGHFYFKEDAEG